MAHDATLDVDERESLHVQRRTLQRHVLDDSHDGVPSLSSRAVAPEDEVLEFRRRAQAVGGRAESSLTLALGRNAVRLA
jgi:hypothetical protein